MDQRIEEAVPHYEHIQQNYFSYRKHKKQKEGDIAVCKCKFDASDAESACGERCLNVLTSTECTPGYCPCGFFCKNQIFQNCEYAKTRLFKTEGRGWGLLADENIKAGQFIIEYCGEVISWKEAKKRSQAYENQGLKDAYIISLNSSESIDATEMGSLARFINHSCQPNCETRKWNVLGEIRVGILAKLNISIGTELTYDYNFEWYGGAKVHCLCGAVSCSGFLGAKSRGYQENTYLWEDDDDRITKMDNITHKKKRTTQDVQQQHIVAAASDDFNSTWNVPIAKRLRRNGAEEQQQLATEETIHSDNDADNTYVQKKKKIEFATRMSPSGFIQLIQNLSNEQKEAVKQIGFGSLLQLKLEACDTKLSKYLVENFDQYRTAIKLQKHLLRLTEQDVVATLDLPNGTVPVVEANKQNDNEGYKRLLNTWRERWGVSNGGPLTTNMHKELVKRGDYTDEFKRDFVVFLVSSMIKGFKNRQCNFKILFSLQDVNKIKDMNWCRYTLNSLDQSVEDWKKNPKSFFTGPLTFLMLSYLDRVEFKGRNVERKFPICSVWSKTNVKERRKKELKSGGFGKGIVVQALKKPTTEKIEKPKKGEKRVVTESDSAESSKSGDDVRKKSVDKISTALKKMASAIMEFGEAIAEIGRIQLGNNILKNTFNSVFDIYKEMSSSTPEEEATKELVDEDDDFFNDPKFLEAVAELEKAILKTQKKKLQQKILTFLPFH